MARRAGRLSAALAERGGGESGVVALLSLGIATIAGQLAVAIGTILRLLYLFPIVISVVSDPRIAFSHLR
jgi:hypothetical protein